MKMRGRIESGLAHCCRALGVGYDVIGDLLSNHLALSVAAALLIAKLIMWMFALGSGTSGGVLAPLLMMDAGLGCLIGPWMPGGDPRLWALVCMAATLGGTMRAPMTAVVFAFGLTHDVNAFGWIRDRSTFKWNAGRKLTRLSATRGQQVASLPLERLAQWALVGRCSGVATSVERETEGSSNISGIVLNVKLSQEYVTEELWIILDPNSFKFTEAMWLLTYPGEKTQVSRVALQ